jgi:hypothetical protein
LDEKGCTPTFMLIVSSVAESSGASGDGERSDAPAVGEASGLLICPQAARVNRIRRENGMFLVNIDTLMVSFGFLAKRKPSYRTGKLCWQTNKMLRREYTVKSERIVTPLAGSSAKGG